METLIAFLAFISFLAFIIGLFKPSLVKMPDRKRSSLLYLGGTIVFCIIGSSLYPVEKLVTNTTAANSATPQKSKASSFEYADLSLKEFSNKPKVTRHEIINEFNKLKEVAATSSDAMYACLSEYSFTKSGDLKVGEVLSWCYNQYEQSPAELSKKINFDVFQDNFSRWDGSYRPLEKLIKENMNDDSSYHHVSTVYSLVLYKDPHAIVKTTFRGKNGFGAIMKSSVTARVNIQTGAVEEIVD